MTISLPIFLLLLVFTAMGSIGSFYFKRMSNSDIGFNKSFVTNFIVGCFFYGSGAILNIIALKFTDYTILFPLTSITYIWTFILSAMFLKEKITTKKIIGLVCIMGGAFLLVS
ncbi:EamA family transporter [Gracilibacillus caseinilyticus]|uniref:EamA family transporter n=1 Tax=Gracilibacillus caseinilyticus TaxID=2932256 RepID=A0ABY4F746_9BACI|nr:EamA family transporter [Gracilibacillus caseinilyticus]UOQ50276.1 EamA family transporter [Gracilibacillus caseinilyticus]